MKLDLTGGGVLALAAVGVAAGLGLWLYSKRGTVAAAAETAVASVNPADSRNLVNRGVSAIGEAVTGEVEWSLGGQLAEWFNPSVRAANDMLATQPGMKTRQPLPYDETERLLRRYPQTGGGYTYGGTDPAETFALGAAP